MQSESFDLSPGRHSWPEKGQPVVFWGKPSGYEIVGEDPDRLKEWETKMAELVGFTPESSRRENGRLGTVSFCSVDPPDDCDSDVLQ